MTVIVTDRETIENGLRIRSSYAVISIRDPGVTKARLPRPTALRSVLHVAFHDAEPAANFVLPPQIKPITRRQALLIWRFVLRQVGQVKTLVVHCHQGMSRSPAVAAAIAHFLGQEDNRFWSEHAPNAHVFRIMQETMPRISNSEGESIDNVAGRSR